MPFWQSFGTEVGGGGPKNSKALIVPDYKTGIFEPLPLRIIDYGDQESNPHLRWLCSKKFETSKRSLGGFSIAHTADSGMDLLVNGCLKP